MLNDYLLSLVRTWVPVGVGSVLTYLGVHYGILLPEDMSGQLAIGVTALVVGAYYTVVRGLEAKWPVFGKLLGKKAQPTYEARR